MKLTFGGGITEDPYEAAFVAWMAADFRPLVRVLLILDSVGLALSIVVIVGALVVGSLRDLPFLPFLIAALPGSALFLWWGLTVLRRLPEVERRHSQIAWGTERPDAL